MPELPEVETVRRGLEKLIVGKTIRSVEHGWDKSFPNDPALVSEFLIGSQIAGVKRRAKVLLIELSTNYTLMVHLKMTGQLVFINKNDKSLNRETAKPRNKTQNSNLKSQTESDLAFRASDLEVYKSSETRFGAGHPNESLIGNLPDKSTRVTVTFNDASKLFFNDQRKFGWMKLLPSELVSEEPFMQKVGPEPLEAAFTDKIFVQRVRRRKGTSIKAAILDQTVLAGVGNIYADECLWGAKIHPAEIVADISDKRLKKLHSELIYVLNLSLEKGGSTDRNYVNAEGKKGSYIDFARVFRREGKPCTRCGATIEKSRVAGRGTHTCPTCQPSP